MRSIIRFILGLSAALGIASTSSAQSYTLVVSITDFYVMNSGILLFYTSGARNGPVPACAVSPRWAINVSTPAGQAQMSGLLSAYLAGRNVQIWGTGTCSVDGSSETVSYYGLR